jgi:hypothetical protein
VLFNH